MSKETTIADNYENRVFPTIEQMDGDDWDGITYSSDHISLSKYLNKQNVLDEKWLIYVRPHLEGLRPDFILLHPIKGMLIIEILRWSDEQLKKSEIIDSEDKKNRCIYKIDNRKVPKPGSDVISLRKNILENHLTPINEFLNSLKENFKNGKYNLFKRNCAIRVGYFYSNVSKEKNIEQHYKELKIKQNIFHICKKHVEEESNINEMISHYDKKRNVDSHINQYWSDGLLDEIKTILTPSLHKVDHGQSINFSSEQKKYIDPKPATKTFLLGTAGSGKSLIIGQRAARLASEKKSVLILTFNITLKKYLLEQIGRAQIEFKYQYIVIKHFHDLARGLKNKYKREPQEVEKDDYFNKIIPEFWIDFLKNRNNHLHDKYDAILIDEAQDYTDEMYHMLKYFKKNADCEILVVFDKKQNVYNRKLSFTKNRTIHSLTKSHRIPEILIPVVNEFAKLYNLEDSHSIPIDLGNQQIIPFFKNEIIWIELEKIDRNDKRDDDPPNDKITCKYCKIEKIPFGEILKKWEEKVSADDEISPLMFLKDNYKEIIIINLQNINNVYELKKLIEIDDENKSSKRDFYKEIYYLIREQVRCNKCEKLNLACFDQIHKRINQLKMEGNNEQDIAIVIPYRWEVEQLNKYLESKKLKTICVNTRNEKVKFDRFDRRIKISTIHSFKGYELSNIIVLTEHNNSNLFNPEIIYTSLTRSTNKLVFINRNEDYSKFGDYLNEYKNSFNT